MNARALPRWPGSPRSLRRWLRSAVALAACAALACATDASRPLPPPPAAPSGPPAAPTPPALAAPQPLATDRAVPPLGPSPELALPPQIHFQLANGLKVRLVEHHQLPIVALHLVVDAGSSRDPADRAGLASFTAAMLTEGTRTRTATQISDQVGYLGASLGAGAGVDAASLSGGVLSQHLPALLDIFADVAMHPAFRPADVERVRDQRRVALLQQRDEPGWLAARAFTETFWGPSPYGHPVIGTEASLAATKREDLARLHDRLWHPANAELVVVGDVTEATLRPLLERTLGKWPAGAAAPPLAAKGPVAPHRVLFVDKPSSAQTYLLLGAPGVSRDAPDHVAATVLFQVVGGGTASRLFRTLREEKGYTYGLGAGADARKLSGASVVRGSVKTEVTGAALKDLLAELAKVRETPVPPDELTDAKDAIVRSLPGDFATVGGIAGRVAELVVYRLPDDYWNRYADAVRAVTADEVRRAADRYLAPDRMTLVLVGTPSAVTPQLTGLPLGPVEVLPPGGTAVRLPR